MASNLRRPASHISCQLHSAFLTSSACTARSRRPILQRLSNSTNGHVRTIATHQKQKKLEAMNQPVSQRELPDFKAKHANESLQVASQDMSMLANQDFGALPQTFIMPTGENLPAFTKKPLTRFSLEWQKFKQSFTSKATILVYRYRSSKRLNTSDITSVAEALHRNMYAAYSAGKPETLKTICGPGLYTKFTQRLRKRPSNMRYIWELTGYTKPTKLTNHKIATLPNDMGHLRQAVVRIQSTQVLTTYVADKKTGPGKTSSTDEYLILQQRDFRGSPDSQWQIWGTVEEAQVENKDFDSPFKAIKDFMKFGA